MKIIEFNSSSEWLSWRREGICASDIAKIIGVSKWGDVDSLLKEKFNAEDKKDNWAMARGRSIEPEIRARLEKAHDVELDTICGHHDNKEWARASFDGIDSNKNYLCEIKTAGIKDHETAKTGLVPDHYYPQVQWQMFVSGFKECRYVSAYCNKETGWEIIEILVEYNESYIDRIMPDILRFYHRMKNEEKSDNISL